MKKPLKQRELQKYLQNDPELKWKVIKMQIPDNRYILGCRIIVAYVDAKTEKPRTKLDAQSLKKYEHLIINNF